MPSIHSDTSLLILSINRLSVVYLSVMISSVRVQPARRHNCRAAFLLSPLDYCQNRGIIEWQVIYYCTLKRYVHLMKHITCRKWCHGSVIPDPIFISHIQRKQPTTIRFHLNSLNRRNSNASSSRTTKDFQTAYHTIPWDYIIPEKLSYRLSSSSFSFLHLH
ncbi:hypothetical protein J6590_019633 [Homalodisca vitripennis]|nr:hypothetical protein J6590_019633 [Homalodisca vitripennis]